MSLIENGFDINDKGLKGRLRHWSRFDHLRPEQGIALLIGLEANEVCVKAVEDWGKDKSNDKKILDFGISLLNGDEIINAKNESQHDEYENEDAAVDADLTEYEDSLCGESDCATEAEYDDNYYAQYANIIKEEHANFNQIANIRFAGFVRLHRCLLQYWNSGEHHKPTPLLYFLEWARSKGINPSWEAVAIELEQTLGETTLNTGKQPEAAPPYSTAWLNIQRAAIAQFFNPRRNPDAKRDEVVEWIKQQAEVAGLPDSNNTATSIFTIIKPANHDPKKKRGEPQ